MVPLNPSANRFSSHRFRPRIEKHEIKLCVSETESRLQCRAPERATHFRVNVFANAACNESARMDSAGKDNVSNGEGQAEPQKPGEAAHAETMPSSGSPNRRKRHRWGWVCAAALALLGILLVLHNEKSRDVKTTEAATKPPAAAVTVGQSKTGDINIYINALGTVTPVYTVTVFSQITGKVTTVHYKEGELVKAGDPLVDIDPQPYQATLTQAEGTLDHDQSVLEQARIDLARYEAAGANAIARQQLEDQIQAVRQAEGSVKADQGAVAFDRVQLSYCHIVSPITGRVGLRLVDPGNTVLRATAPHWSSSLSCSQSPLYSMFRRMISRRSRHS